MSGESQLFNRPTFGTPRDGVFGDGHDRLEARLRACLVDEIDCGLIVCDGSGNVRLVNRSAERELASARLLSRGRERLVCHGTATPSLELAVRQAFLKARRQLVTLSQGSDRLVLLVAPLLTPGDDEPLVLLMLGRRGLCSALALEMLSSVHGLTLAERRVLAALLDEAAPRQIAAAHGVALSTVRTQITSIRNKLGVRSVEALLVRAAEVPQVPSALRQASPPMRLATPVAPHPAY
jgi:DNA-binding CsgD family transcriptional regulator